MKKLILRFVLIMASLKGLLAADLVVNGSFESPNVLSTSGHGELPVGAWFTVPASGAIPGWQATGGAFTVLRTPYNEGYGTIVSADGVQSVDLTAESPDGQGGVEQTVTTVPGRDYVLTFQLGVYPGSSAYGGPIRVRATAGSATAEFQHDAAPSPGGVVWQSFALPFKASNGTTLIRLQNLQANSWCGLDRVAIAAANPVGAQPNLFLLSSTIAGGAGAGKSNNGRFSVTGTIGQADAGLLEANGKHLAAGFWGPVNRLNITRQGTFVRVAWDFGLGFGELQTTDELLTSWIPVSLTGNAPSVVFPATEAKRFFRMLEN